MQQVSQFCVWYLPCQKGGFSFPSGHTSSFACSFLFLLSTPLVQKHKHTSVILICASIFLMMASRIIMGAHFLSDTTAGMMIALIIWAFYDKQWGETKRVNENTNMPHFGILLMFSFFILCILSVSFIGCSDSNII